MNDSDILYLNYNMVSSKELLAKNGKMYIITLIWKGLRDAEYFA